MSDLFDVSRKTKASSDFLKGVLGRKAKISPMMLNVMRGLLSLTIVALLVLKTPHNIAFAMDNVFVRVLLVLSLIFLAIADPVSSVLLLVVFCVIYYQKEEMKMRLDLLKYESFRGGLQSYAGIGEDSNQKYDDSMEDDIEYVKTSTTTPTGMSLETGEMDSTKLTSDPANRSSVTSEENMVTFVPSTTTQFDRIQNNIVGDEESMNTEVRTWVNESGPQGMSYPSGYPLDSFNEMNNVDMLTPF